MEDGDKVVFEYDYKNEDCETINDGFHFKNLIFEIDKGLTESNFTDEEISQTNCVYRESGFWITSGAYLVSEGSCLEKRFLMMNGKYQFLFLLNI